MRVRPMAGPVRSPLLLVFPLFLVASAGAALEVESVRWGFDGRPYPESFNPLTIEFSNPGNEPFMGAVQLTKRIGLGGKAGATEIQPCSIAPGGRRTVQFLPYVGTNADSLTWRLEWNGGSESLNEVRLAVGAASVELISGDVFAARDTSRLDRFPARYFPTTAGATDPLASAVLAHDPQWEEARAKAFLQWLHRGGQLHLFHDANGSFPNFEGILATLNDTSAASDRGQGKVYRYAKQPTEITLDELQRIRNVPKVPNESYNQQGRHTAFAYLGALSRPDVAWGLIYLAAFFYIFLLGPVHYFLSTRRFDYRLSIVSLLVLIGVFSLLFMHVGRRGYGEKDRLHSVAVARPVGEGLYDVRQWSHAFMTRGDDYQFRYHSPHQLFAFHHQMNAVPGMLKNGFEGMMQVDIPVYSSRNLVSQSVLPGPNIHVEQLRSGNRDFDLRITGLEAIRHVWVRQGSQLYRYEERGDRWVKWSAEDIDQHIYPQPHMITRYKSKNTREREAFQRIGPALLHAHQNWRQPFGIEVLIYADLPETFYPSSPTFEKRSGRALYIFDLNESTTRP